MRPSYPTVLVAAACARAGLEENSKVLEIGCGTGKLTTELARRRLHVDAVEPGARLVEVARERLGDSSVRFHLERFEDVELGAEAYDAVFSATAFHWVDPDVGWSKVARLLRRNGVFALLQLGLGGGELDQELLGAWREVLPEASTWPSRDAYTLWHGADVRRVDVSELWSWLTNHELARPVAVGVFTDVELLTVPVAREETAETCLSLLRTTSTYLGLDQAVRALFESRIQAIFERAGGVVRATELATLVTARKRD